MAVWKPSSSEDQDSSSSLKTSTSGDSARPRAKTVKVSEAPPASAYVNPVQEPLLRQSPLPVPATQSCGQIFSIAGAWGPVIRPLDLFRGFYEFGRTKKYGAAKWLYDQLGPDLFPPVPPQRRAPPSSDTVLAVFAKAAAIRARTGGADKLVHARILLYALLTQPGAQAAINASLADASLKTSSLRLELKSFLEKNLDRGEQLDPWRAIFAEDEASVSLGNKGPNSDRQEDRVPTQSDDPATLDQLDRKGFAVVLRQNIRNFRNSIARVRDAGAFMLLVDGAWGSGKSSVLNLLKDELRNNDSEKWLIVYFNA